MKIAKKHESYLTKQKPLPWSKVLDIWRKNEADREEWKRYWKKEGFDSWEAWRMQYIEAIDAQNRNWELYDINLPTESVPKFHGGPFQGWIKKYYDGKSFPTFTDIIDMHPELRDHNKIQDMLDDGFPKHTTLTGLVHNGRIHIFEGMHRCTAITFAQKENTPDIIGDVSIALSDHPQPLPKNGIRT